MKKIILLGVILLICGCQNVKDLTIEDVIHTFNIEENNSNIYRIGYKYELPRGMQADENMLYNEVISNGSYDFYLYLDLVSYNAKKILTYNEVSDIYYSKNIAIGDKTGYLEINLLENNKYLIEIMYNYAKIEVMVELEDINESLLYSINVLKSVKYNDSVIDSLISDDLLYFTEEEYNIFNTTSSDSIYLDFDNTYIPETEEEYDHDLLY